MVNDRISRPIVMGHVVMPRKGMASYNMRGWEEHSDRDVSGVTPVFPKLVVERVHPDAVLPKYASEGDSGMDVYSPINVLVRPQETVLVKTGIRMEIPRHPFHNLGYRWEAQNRPRSGLSLKTEILPKFGTIDNTYRGEVGVILKNDAQLMYSPYVTIEREDMQQVSDVYLHYEEDDGVEATDLQDQRVSTFELEELGVIDTFTKRLPMGTLLIRKGDRIAQMVFNEVIRPMEIVEGTVSTDTDRGSSGFGSTGVQG